ncbi:chaperonin 10-like protein [Bombardia bombarda]|uniref:Chaperonin 10-like protein n=1 Tax=Bombardia bombarda TaxID=252184 RepID=A0AA39XM12_9PEZI|nr:chaperonin 10-like protein [Bombardia bombarda]
MAATTTIPPKMKAARVTAYNTPYTLTTIPTPTPTPSSLGPYDLLIKIAVASHCHTDTMVASGTFATALPCTGSHEGAGTVVSAGSSAATSFHPGDRVMCGIPLHPCGRCADCDPTSPESQRQYCTAITGHVGVTVDGCFAEYARVDARSSTHVPDCVSLLSAAPLACAGRTAWRAVAQAGLQPGQTLAIVGSGGGLGHLAIQFAKGKGLFVVGVDARDEGLALSRDNGADVVLDARKGKAAVVGEVQRLTDPAGVDAAITLADADGAAALACAVTKPHGTMVQVAQPDEVRVPFQELIFRDIRIKGSLICSYEESRDMMAFIAEHGVSVRTVPFYGLDRIHELVEAVEMGRISGKAAIVVDEEQLEREKEFGAKY